MHEDERLENILSILRRQKTITNSKLCSLLFCSPSTLRRDLLKLEASGQIKRSHGGVSLITNNNEFSFLFRENINSKEKDYIANLASDYIAEGQAIFLDSSSTTYKLCYHLQNKKLIIVTNSLKTAINLNYQDNVTVFTPGGQVKNNSTAVVGEMALEFFKDFNADIAFLSCRGISLDGVFEADLNQALIKQRMMANAKKTVLLIDNTKYDSEHFFKLCDFGKIDAIVTDNKPNDEYMKVFEGFDCDVVF